MGIFTKNICSICNEGNGSKKLADGYICKDCVKKCFPFIVTLSWKDISSENANRAIEATNQNEQLSQIFKPTKKVEKYISFDEVNKLWKANSSVVIFNYNDIINFELIEDGNSISQGAFTGGIQTNKIISELKIKITTRKEMCPEIYIFFVVTGSVKANSIVYRSYKRAAESIISQLTIIADSVNRVGRENQFSEADEILKYKKLCDNGIITQEEFIAKKNQLLGL